MKSAYRLIVIFGAMLLFCNSLAAYSESLGRVIFLRATGGQSDSPTDVMEKNLDTGHTETLISHESLPKSFKTRVASVSPSPNGKYLYITSSPGWVFKDKATGKTRTVFGETFSYGGEEEPAETIDKRSWCWERGEAAPRSIVPPSDCIGSGRLASDSPTVWAPEGNRLLCRRDLDDSPYTNCLYLYNATSRITRTLSLTKGLNMAVWSGNGDSVIEIRRTKNEGSMVSRIGVDGKSRQLFTWPRRICGVTQSPNGSVFALFDLTGCYLLGTDGQLIAKLKIPMQKESFEVSFRFNKSGNCLGVLTSYWYGEPHVGLDQQLWVVDMKSKQARRIARWGEFFQGSDLATERWIEGWFPDQQTVVIAGAINYGAEKPADSENDWIKIWAYNTQLRTGKGMEIFDSGKRCLGVAWW